jgi:carotenoid cleavage dioxygenase-like enzyme
LGRRVFAAPFGTLASRTAGGNLLNVVPKNIANTNVVEWGGRLLALYEARTENGTVLFSAATASLLARCNC